MKWIFPLLFFPVVLCNAQEFAYTPSKSDLPSKKKFEERLEMNLATDIQLLSGKVKNNKEIEEIYTSRANYIHLMATEQEEYIFGTPLNDYIETIFQNLLNANPQFDKERSKLYVSRDIAPNASCFGEGTLVINIGLIRRLENESQVAFVLAHELAHLQENHVNNAILNFVENKNDRETQQEIKRITKMKYSRNDAGLSMLKNVMYDSSRHSRLHESDADEKALEIMSKAGYDVGVAPEALRILDIVDQEKYAEEIVIHREFNRELYPFKPEWKEEENPLAIFFEKDSREEIFDIHPDSLKTHPNTIKRAENASSTLANYESGDISQQAVSAHEKAVIQADFDLVLSAYHYKNYGYAIYQSLQMQQKFPEHPFLVGIIGACMGEMAEAIDNHELGKILPASSPEFSDNYNELLSFLNNLSMKEMIEVGYNYVRIYADKADQSGALAYALALTSGLKDKNEERNKYKNIYNKNFAGGYFSKAARKVY